MHPAALITVKVCEPAPRPVIVVVVPVPVAVTPPGLFVIVHVPVAGNPFKTTLPVDKAQVGCVTVPIIGAPGEPSGALITILEDDVDIHPGAFDNV